MSTDPAKPDLLSALNTYVNSVRLCAGHATRIVVLGHRVQVLSTLGHELFATLQVQHEAAKEAIEIADDPKPPAYIEFLATLEEYKVVYKLLQSAVAEAVAEKDFVDWHTAHAILPEYDTAMKLLQGGK